jgi:adenylate kinase
MNILFLGPQGSGKGTQARQLVGKYKYFYLSAGDILRMQGETDPELKAKIDRGEFLKDEETVRRLTRYLDENKVKDKILFDGFPRSVIQYNLTKKWLAAKGSRIDKVIVLTLSEDESLRRLSARRMDPVSGRIYNLITDPPKVGVDISKLVQRDDDKPEAIKKRLAWYNDLTKPLIDQLKKETQVFEIDGERPVEVISQDILKALQK